jgi:hypothetical protein
MLSISRLTIGAAIVLAAVAAVATLSSGPAPNPSATKTFSGTIAREEVSAHTFTIPVDGTVEVTLTGLGPKAAASVGLGLGTPTAAGNCSLVEASDATRVAGQVGGALQKGTYCVAVYDSGNAASEPLDYTVSVTEE